MQKKAYNPDALTMDEALIIHRRPELSVAQLGAMLKRGEAAVRRCRQQRTIAGRLAAERVAMERQGVEKERIEQELRDRQDPEQLEIDRQNQLIEQRFLYRMELSAQGVGDAEAAEMVNERFGPAPVIR